jgi:hypothetical protein
MFHSYGMDFIGREITPLVRIERAIVLYPVVCSTSHLCSFHKHDDNLSVFKFMLVSSIIIFLSLCTSNRHRS